MNFWNLLLENNAYLLIFSATGFILSLIWYIVSERRRRDHIESKQALTDEASFFSQFEDLENPALKIPEFHNPIRSSLPHSVRTQKTEERIQDEEPTQEPERTQESEHTHDEASDKAHDERVRDAILRAEALKFKPNEIPHVEEEAEEDVDYPEPSQESQAVDAKPAVISEEQKINAASSEMDPHYDEDEQKVKELLEQIKKDMREQGEQTS